MLHRAALNHYYKPFLLNKLVVHIIGILYSDLKTQFR